MTLRQLKPTDAVIVFTDKDTGKAYAIQLGDIASRLVFGVLPESYKAVEIAPFILRSVGVSEQEAIRRIESARLADVNDLVGKRVTAKISSYKGGPQQIPRPQPVCAHDWIPSEGRTASGVVCSKCGAYEKPEPNEMQYATCYQCGQSSAQHARYGDEDNPDALTYHCKMCDAEQCERVRCVSCGKVCTRPDGSHYCGGKP